MSPSRGDDSIGRRAANRCLTTVPDMWAFRTGRERITSPLPTLPLSPGRLQLAIPLGVDLLLPPGEHLLRGDVADSTVHAHVIVMNDIALYQTPRIFELQGRSWADALSFERFVPALDLSIRLRIVGRSSERVMPRDPNELLEVLGNQIRPVVRDDPWRVQFLGPLQDDLDVRLRHRLPQIPVDDVSAAAVQNAAR